jgi:sulfate transport system ATP-binding protein
MSLARALAIKPRVLLLDEPFAALDAQVRHDLRGWVHDLQRELGITTILVTHDQSEAMEVADSLVVLNAGRIEQVGTPSSIYDSPATDFVRTFVGPTTIFRGSVVRPHQLRVAHSGPGELVVVDDIIVLGFEVRIHVVTNDGSRTWIQLSHEEALELGIRCGDQVVVSIRTLALKGGADEAPTKRPTKEHIS